MELFRELQYGVMQWVRFVKYTCEQQAEPLSRPRRMSPLSKTRVCQYPKEWLALASRVVPRVIARPCSGGEFFCTHF